MLRWTCHRCVSDSYMLSNEMLGTRLKSFKCVASIGLFQTTAKRGRSVQGLLDLWDKEFAQHVSLWFSVCYRLVGPNGEAVAMMAAAKKTTMIDDDNDDDVHHPYRSHASRYPSMNFTRVWVWTLLCSWAALFPLVAPPCQIWECETVALHAYVSLKWPPYVSLDRRLMVLHFHIFADHRILSLSCSTSYIGVLACVSISPRETPPLGRMQGTPFRTSC